MPNQRDVERHLARTEMPLLVDAAAKVAGFDLGKRPEFASAANVSGVRTRTVTYSQRRDSRTIFAADSRYGVTGKNGTWRGGDRELVAACRRVVRAAGVPAKEIAGVDVQSEFGTTGERVDGGMRVEEPTLLQKLAFARRALDGLAVWSSYTKVGLTADGRIGCVELHWPVIAAEISQEATVLQSILTQGFKPPEMEGARPTSTEAGILHSPAIGFMMDVTAAIRVVYEPLEPEMGRLATLYLDRHGELVNLPRSIKVTKPEDREREHPG